MYGARKCTFFVWILLINSGLEFMRKEDVPQDEKYFSGVPGDFLAANENDLSDCWIVNERIFYKTYEEMVG